MRNPLFVLLLGVTAGAGDAPSVVVSTPSDVVSGPVGGLQEVYNYVTNVRAGSTAADDGETLCGGTACTCTVSNPSLFTSFPALHLLNYKPTFANPTTGTLKYRLVTPIAGFPKTSTVSCTVPDSAGSTLALPAFTATVNGLTWAPPTTALSCTEDTPCLVAPLFTNLNDNNGGSLRLPLPCPPGGSSTCFYEITSSDVRWNSGFFTQPLQLSDTPATGCVACRSDLNISLASDVNTVGTWSGVSGPITFTLLVRDDQGNTASPVTFTLTVAAANDPPSANLVTLVEVTYDAGSLTSTVANVLTHAVSGPAAALDEAAETFPATQVCTGSASLFVGSPTIQTATGDLTFTLQPGLQGYPTYSSFPGPGPISTSLTCTLTDSGGASTTLPAITVRIYPSNSPPYAVCAPACDVTVTEDSTVAVDNFFTVAGSTPPGLAWELTDTVTLQGCTITADTCVSSTGTCLTGITATGVKLDRLEATVVGDAVGRTNFTCTFGDNGGETTIVEASVTVVEANDAPTAVLRGALVQSSFYSNTNFVTVFGFVDSIRQGNVGSLSENSQVLCGGGDCVCTASDVSLFGAQPKLDLSTNTPSAASPATASLVYAFAAGLSSTDRSASVVCRITDDAGGTATLQTFTITATSKPSWTPATNTVTCYEDGTTAPSATVTSWCTITGFLTQLNDNNGGNSVFSSVSCPKPCSPLTDPCPPSTVIGGGGGASTASQCWYSATSSDPRFNDITFLQVKPYLAAAPANCADATPCSSDLVIQTGADANTGASPIPVTITVRDTSGNAVTRNVNLEVLAVNDKPTVAAVSTAATIQSTGVEVVLPYVEVRPGTATAVDEDGQKVSTTCTAGTAGVFKTAPTLRFSTEYPTAATPATADLRFTLATLTTFPTTVSVQCTVADSEGGSITTPTYTLTVLEGPPTWVPLSSSLTCDEDNSAAPSTSASPCIFTNFVTSLNDNKGGVSTFTVSPCPSATCWYELTSADSRWNTMFAVDPVLTSPAPMPCVACASDLTFTLMDNFNTGGTPVIFTVVVRDSTGRAAAAVDLSLTVPQVNDLPTWAGGMDVTMVYSSSVVTIANFVTAIAPGPPTAVDELSETVAINCTAATPAMFALQPDMIRKGGTADLVFQVSDTITFPASTVATCALTDSKGSQSNVQFTITVSEGPPQWVPATYTLTGYEDNSVTPSTVQGVPFVYSSFVTNLDANGKGAANFDAAACPASPCWYSITTTDDSFFSVPPALSQPACAGNICTSDLSFSTGLNSYGKANITVIIRNTAGYAAEPRSVEVTVLSVNDLPAARVTAVPNQNVLWNDTTAKVVNYFLSNITAGPNEPGQAVTVVCSNSNPVMFSVQPKLTITGTYADLSYALAGGLQSVSATVSCVLSDGNAQYSLAPFSILASVIPTWSLLVPSVTCYEDGINRAAPTALLSCYHPDFVTSLVDNNNGASGFSETGCPGAASCWYSVTSDDPRWPTMFKVQPTLTAPQVPCVSVGCTADLRYTLADNVNTQGGVVRFGVVLRDSSGRVAETRYAMLDVPPVNDAPTADFPTAISPNGQTVANFFPDLFTNVQPGPWDEATQNVTAVCEGTPAAVFSSTPVVTVHGTTADLSFTLRQALPPEEGAINCTLFDTGNPVEQQALQPIRLLTLLSWVSSDIVCSEDGVSLPSTSAVECEVRDFIRALDDNNEGMSVFAAPWYEFTSTDARWPAIVASGPMLTPIQYCKGTCASHLTLTLADDANTRDGPVLLNFTVRDNLGRSTTKVVSLEVPTVNDYPTCSDVPSEVMTVYTDTSPQSYTLVTSVRVGSPRSFDEDGQMLCNGSPCLCSASPNIFFSVPVLALTTYTPKTVTGGTTGTLLFTLRPGLTGLERSQVSCSLSDGNLVYVLNFVITAEDPADPLCTPYVFPDGVEAGTADGCLNGTSLSQTSDPSCTVQCQTGFTGASSTITCPFASAPSCVPNSCGVAPTSTSTNYAPCSVLPTRGYCDPTCYDGYHKENNGFELVCSTAGTYTDPDAANTCVENKCLVSLPKGTRPGGSDPCANGMLLSTASDTSCTVQCDVGFYDNNSTNIASCAPTAAHGSLAVVSADCTPSCSMYKCPSGVLKPNPGTIACPSGLCSFNACCNSFCDTFAGCTAGYMLKANPSAINCNDAACTRDMCCDVSCDIATFTACSTAGYVARQPASEIKCPASGCDKDTCCLATCDNKEFTSCQHGHYTLKPNPSFIKCSGGNAGRDCNIPTCCLSTCYIDTLVCRSGLTKKLSPASIACDETGCTEERCCDALCGYNGFTCTAPAVLRGSLAAPERCANHLPSSCTQYQCCTNPCENVICSPVDECHGAGACVNGKCGSPLLPDGTTCTSGICRAGNCLEEVTCGTTQCYVDSCTTATCGGGSCLPVARPNTQQCNDNSALTATDQCVNGVCTGVPLCQKVICHQSSQCHEQGICDPITGTCTVPTKPDGTLCDDGEDMTADDACVSGACIGRWRCAGAVCPFKECHRMGSCNITTELCEYERVPDLERCRTTQSTTSYCLSGVCVDPTCGCVASGPCRVSTCQGNSCLEVNAPDGDSCMINGTDDGRCSGGICAPVAKCFGVACPVHKEQCYGQSFCHNETGECTDPATLPDYTPCDDGLGTTVNSVCEGGVCRGSPKCEGVTCPILQCKGRGICNDQTGLCEYGSAFNGISCSDGITATDDICIDGRCIGRLPCSRMTCTAEECMYPTCINGKCSESPVADESPCDNGQGQCSNGLCVTRDVCEGVVCVPRGQCKAHVPCWNSKCADVNKPDGSPCDDGNEETVNDVCQAGVCSGVGGCACSVDECKIITACTATVCNWAPASNGAPCTGGVCVNTVCEPTGSCGPTRCTTRPCYTSICNGTACVDYAVADGTLCDDQNGFTMDDACYLQQNKGSACIGVDKCKGVTCSPVSQCHTAGVCNALAGTCSTPLKPENTSCDDNNPETKLDRCVQGTCVGERKCASCPKLPCSTQGICDPLTGACRSVPYPDGAACDDSNPATVNDKCFKGTCVGSAPCGSISCSASRSCHTPVCLQDSCVEVPMSDGTVCSLLGNYTEPPTCRAGRCVEPNVCFSLSCPQPTQCYEDTSECFVVDGFPKCTSPPKPNYTPCDDRDIKTENDVCINGACVGTSLCASPWCPYAGQCYERTLCNVTTGECPVQQKPDGTPCSDEDPFTWDDGCYGGTCLGVIECVNSTNGTCRPSSQCHNVLCLNDAQCVETVLTDTPCDDGDSTTIDDMCTSSGVCQGSDICNIVCTPAQCQNSSWCNRGNGTCMSTPMIDGTPCDDGRPQTSNDQCVSGMCMGWTTCQGVVCVASDPCHDPGECEEATGTCSNPNKQDRTKCDDGSSLTINDQCLAGVCVGADACAGLTCEAQNDCYEMGTCLRGVCTNPMRDDGTLCSNSTGTCMAGECIVTNPCDNVMCQPSDSCHTTGVCNVTTGFCTDPPVADGTVCDDTHPETFGDQCVEGVCRGRVQCGSQTCIASDVCYVAFCSGTACTQLALDGEPCNDNDPTTSQDMCMAGLCVGVSNCDGVVCSTSDPCMAAGVCNPLNGQCTWKMAPDGTQCDDKNSTTINDHCNAGVCKGEPPCNRPCTASSECQVNGICDLLTGVCPELPLPDLSPCNDNDPNTEDEICMNGVCSGTISCDGVSRCRASTSCKRPACDNDLCTEVNLPDGSTCTDFNSQTRDDTCQAGVCMGVASCTSICTRLSQCHDVGVCEPITGLCSTPVSPLGTPCDDGNPFTHQDNCENGVCVGTQRCTLPCSPSDQCHVAGICDPSTGICTDPMVPDNTRCDDGNPSTGDDICINGICIGGLPCGTTACYSTNQCETPQCDNGACSVLMKTTSSQCNDGNVTTFNDRCVGAVCQGTAKCEGKVCTMRECFIARCDALTGGCSYDQAPNNTACDDSNPLTYNDACRDGVCVGVSLCENVTCAALSACHAVGMCDPAVGVCTNPLRPDNAVCDDGSVLTTNDVCINGVCTGTIRCGGTTCAATACETPQCLDNTTCTSSYKPDGTLCDDGSHAAHRDTCQQGMCVGRGPCWGVTCPPPSPCHQEGLCSPITGVCIEMLRPDGTPCDDKDANTRNDSCVAGVCVGKRNCEDVSCAADSACRNDGVCDPTDGLCTEPTQTDGTVCDDSNVATLDDRCMSGVCVGVITCSGTTCASTDQCKVSFCDTNGACVEAIKADGTPCSDNDPRTLVDYCVQGVCTPVDLCENVLCQGDMKCLGPGTCDPRTGICSLMYLPENTVCNDGDDNTVGDKCTHGVCAGVDKCSLITCDIINQCASSSACDPNTGLCIIDFLPDSTPCSDGDMSTTNDTCARGSCLGGKLCGSALCLPRGQCYASSCVGAACVEDMKQDGTLCDDNNPATISDMCIGGVCTGTDPCSGVSCLSADACQLDGVCVQGKCYHRLQPDGTTCDDSLSQTGNDRCVSGVCIGYVECGGMVCTPQYPQCQYPVCNGTQCAQLTKPDGVACNDGIGSTENDQCLAGLCVDSSPCRGIVCKPITQCHLPGACADDVFKNTGTCSTPFKVGAVPCDDGDTTTAGDVCGNGVCMGTPKCDKVVCVGDQCHSSQCDPLTGLCNDLPVPDGAGCNDDYALSTGDRCISGTCVGSVTCDGVQCPQSLEPCQRAACDNSDCVVLKLDGVPCNDEDVTTRDDVCRDGVCVGVDVCMGVVCPQSTECIVSQCQYGLCNTVTKPNNTVCDDGNPQTVNDRCTNGMCFGDNPCELGECGSSCEGTADGTPCDDGLTLSIDDRCVRGVCTGTYRCFGVSCKAPSDCHEAGTCNPFTGLCTNPTLPDDTPCDDGDIVTLEDKCLNGVCVGRVKCGSTFCSIPGQCVMAYCIGDMCAQRSRFDATSCDDEDPVTAVDSCLNGQCVGRDLCKGVVCAASDDCHEVGECDKVTGRCTDPMKADGAYCTVPQIGTCAAGSCVPTGVPCDLVVCTTTSPCHVPRCEANACVLDQRPNYSPCNDNNPSTLRDRCFEGVCTGEDLCTSVVCQDDACHTTGTCDPRTGLCNQPLRQEGTRCNDGNIDTVDDMCMGGGCVGVAMCGGVRCMPSAAQCKVSICNGLSCDETNAVNGSPCSDLNELTFGDSCWNGTCVGTAKCLNVACFDANTCVQNMGCDPRSGRCIELPLQGGIACTALDGSAGVCSSGTCNIGVPCGLTTCYSTGPQCYYAGCKDGKCTDNMKYDGALCNDDDSMTVGDKCTAGTCRGVMPCVGVTCAPLGQCHISNSCNKNTGQCDLVLKEATEVCDDANGETADDRCIVGTCRGTLTCNGLPCRASNPQCQVADCVANVCVQRAKPVGTLCDDFNRNTTSDKCQEDGMCRGRDRCAGVQCSSSRACYRAGVCDPLTGQCSEVVEYDGTPCLGGACMSGGCVANVSCANNEACLPLEPQCTVARCNGLLCQRGVWKPDGTPCSDGNATTFDDVCQEGKCAGVSKCANVMCISQDPCRLHGTCDPATGLCTEPYSPDGTMCNDTNVNTANDVCAAGMCRGDLVCGSALCIQSGPCKVPKCVNGACEEVDRYDGTPCNDHKEETFDDQCMAGVCVGIDRCAGVQCQPPGYLGPLCYGMGMCDPRTGLCQYPVLQDNTLCGSGGVCMTGTCIYPLTCGSETCPPNTQCTTPVCAVNASCATTAAVDGTPCTDGDDTTLNDVCISAVCTGINMCEGVVCTALDQCHDVGVCDFKTGRCTQPQKPEATPCDDSVESTIMDSCMAGACIGVTVCGGQNCLPTRSYCRQVICEQAVCSELLLDNVPCDDANLMSTSDRCYAGFCSGLNLCDGVSCSAKGDCYSAGQCDIDTGICSNPVKLYRDTCDDLFPDTTDDTCTLGACSGVMQCNGLPCSTPDPCKTALCNATTCVVTNKLNGSACDDFNDKTFNDVCGSGVCRGVDRCQGVVCQPQSECHFVGVCDGRTGRCTNLLKSNGSSCSTGECTIGTCVKKVSCFGTECTVADPRCQAPSCNVQGFCESLNRPAGTPCDDFDADTVSDACDGNGLCMGAPHCDVASCPELECKTAIGCDSLSKCLYDDLPDNSICNDGEDTTADRCLGGQCVGIADCGMYKCMAPDQCTVAVCITSKCAELTKDDGAYCDDGDPNTIDDRCLSGVCVGTDKCTGVVCGISDQCHTQGDCNKLTGQCTDPRTSDGTACNDADVQSVTDTCTAGSCFGRVLCGDTHCTPPTNQCLQVVCNAGTCTHVAKPNGTKCNDEDVSTTLDECKGGACVGEQVTCANGALRPDASPSVCATKPNANETVCPFGVCDGSTCCDTCLNVDAELCACKALVINARSKRCPPGGCDLDMCCSAGMHIADMKLTSAKAYTELSLLDRAMVRIFALLLNIEESMVTNLRIFDLGNGQSGVDVSVAGRPTTTAPSQTVFAQSVQGKVYDDITNGGSLAPFEFLTVRSSPSSEAVGTALVVINVTLQTTTQKVQQDEELFLTALSKASGVPRSMLSHPKVIAVTPTVTIARVIAKPCGIDTAETSKFILGELEKEQRKGSRGYLERAGFPLSAYAVSNTVDSAVQGTLAMLLTVSPTVPPDELPGYVSTYVSDTGGIIDASCVESLTYQEQDTYRLEALISDITGNWNAEEWAHYLRKSSGSKLTVVSGVRVVEVQAEPTKGDCVSQPCGCGQRCVDDDVVDGVFTCRCRYPYNSGSAAAKAFCVENELTVLARDAVNPEKNKVQVANNLLERVNGIGRDEYMWGDGKWVSDAIDITQQLAGESANPAIEEALLKASEALVAQAGNLWSECCHADKLKRFPGHCCGDITDQNKLRVLSNLVGDSLGSIMSTSTLVNPPLSCLTKDCISTQGDSAERRAEDAAIAKRYLLILHRIGEQLCEAEFGNVVSTGQHGVPYIKQSTSFGIHSVLLSREQQTAYFPIDFARFRVVFEGMVREAYICRTVIEINGLTPYRGKGYPHRTPVGAVLSVRYIPMGIDPRPDVEYAFTMSRARVDQSANEYRVSEWDMPATDWKVVGGVEDVTSTTVNARYAGVVSGASSLATDDILVVGTTERIYPDNSCFACRALPVVWGVALALVMTSIGIRLFAGKFVIRPQGGQLPLFKEFLLTHYWTRIMYRKIPGFAHTKIHKAVVMAAFVVDGWGVITVFYPNKASKYEWEVDMGTWVIYGLVVGVMGSLLPPTLDYVAMQQGEVFEKGAKGELVSQDIEPPTTEQGLFVKVWRVVYFFLPVAASVVMFMGTDEYNTDKQEERYIKTFVAGALFNIFVFEPIRAVTRMCGMRRYLPPDNDSGIKPASVDGDVVELREAELFEDEEGPTDITYDSPIQGGGGPTVLSSYHPVDGTYGSPLSTVQQSINGVHRTRQSTSPENIISAQYNTPPTMPSGRGRGNPRGQYIRTGPARSFDDNDRHDNPLALFSQYSNDGYNNVPV